MPNRDLAYLQNRARWLRRRTLDLSLENGGYHFGGSLSAAETLVALHDEVMTPDDAFILSKGHATYAWYPFLIERGYKPNLEGHPTYDPTNGIEFTTGSLGHGLPLGLGRAFARKIKGDDGRIYVLMGDGECQEGTTWESLLLGRQHRLDNLTAIVDYNKLQGSGRIQDILSLDGFPRVAETIGWQVSEVDGHSFLAILDALGRPIHKEKPRMIIAHTIKGKGISFMEDRSEWHAHGLTPEQIAQAYEELK